MRASIPKLLLAGAGLSLAAGASQAQPLTRSWVSENGVDTNPCTYESPCRTFLGAIANTAAGGEVSAIGTGDYGPIFISKAIAIRNAGAEAGVLAGNPFSFFGVTIDAGPDDVVILDGLDIYGGSDGHDGVEIRGAGDVVIRNCLINAFGHLFHSVTTGGVHLEATAASTRVTIDSSTIVNSVYGVLVDGTAGLNHVKILDSKLLSNTTAGVRVVGAGNDALLSNVRIIGSAKALDLVSGGTAKSYGDNVLTSGDRPTTLPTD
jgi:hypothetical protein